MTETLTDYFLNIVAREICSKLDHVCKLSCNGCQISHASQDQHNICLILNSEEKVEQFFDRAESMIDIHAILAEYNLDADDNYRDYFVYIYNSIGTKHRLFELVKCIYGPHWC
jgi:hypothetical protein